MLCRKGVLYQLGNQQSVGTQVCTTLCFVWYLLSILVEMRRSVCVVLSFLIVDPKGGEKRP